MSARCDREDLLLDALGNGFVGDELRAHVGGCSACTELELVAGALISDGNLAMAKAPIPSSEVMLWKMKARKRREAEARARHSLALGQAISLTAGVVLIATLIGLRLIPMPVDALGPSFGVLFETIRIHTVLWLSLAVAVVVLPIAGFFAFAER